MSACSLLSALSISLLGQSPSLVSQSSLEMPPIVAIVGDEAITREQLDKRLTMKLYSSVKRWPATVLERERPLLLRQMLEKMIEGLLILQEARRQAGSNQPISDPMLDAEIDERIKRMREQGSSITSREGYYRVMKELFGMTRQEARQQIREEMTVLRFLAKHVHLEVDPFVAPSQARYYYRTHLEQFTEPVQVAFRQILLLDSRVVYQYIRKISEQLKNGVSFEEVARNYSDGIDDPELRGRLYEMSFKEVEQWLSPIPETLRTMPEGEIAGPLRSERFFHYLKLEKRVQGDPKSFEEVQPDIDREIRLVRRILAERRLIEKLARNSRIEKFLPPLPEKAAVPAEEESKDQEVEKPSVKESQSGAPANPGSKEEKANEGKEKEKQAPIKGG